MASFVKSYITNKVADKVATIDGIESVMVNIGGDLVIKGKNPEKRTLIVQHCSQKFV